MTNYTKPSNNEVNKVWATTAPTTNVQAPDDSYINLGWTQVKPPSEYFNWWMKKVDTLLAYSNQKGIPEWDANTEYQANTSFVQHKGELWLCLVTATNSEPSAVNTNWCNYLRGLATQSYTDTAVNNLKNSLHKVATTGLASDLQGYLPWSQLSDVPQWIRETHTDSGQLYMRSPDGTQYRLGNNRLDFFNESGNLIFSVSPSGEIDNGTININRVTGAGSAARNNTGDFDVAGSATNAKNEALSKSTLRDSSRRSGFINSNRYAPYLEYYAEGDGSSEVIPLAREAWVKEQVSSIQADYVVRDSSRRSGFIGGNKYAPYLEYKDSSGNTEVIELARQAYLGEQLGKLGTLSTQNSDYINVSGGNITLTQNAGTYRLINGTSDTSYGSFWRMDSNALYLMLTAKGDPRGSYRDKGTPLSVELESGTLKLNNSTEVYGGLELFNGSGTPFIDFHFGGDTGDYTTRLIETSKGKLSVYGEMTWTKPRETLNNLGFDVNKSAKGHQQIGNNGIIIQWGSWSAPARGQGNWVGFDKSFPNGCMGVVVGVANAASQMAGCQSYNNSGFIATTGNEDPLGRSGWYIAIGW